MLFFIDINKTCIHHFQIFSNRVAPQNHCELHRVILRIKEEITANEEKTSSSSAASTPSHTDKPPSKTKYNIPEHRISCEITNSSPIQSNEEHIYTNGLSNFNSGISNNEIDSDQSNYRNERSLETSEICNMMLGCDISSSTSGVDTSTAGSSSFSDSNNGVDRKQNECNESGISSDKFDEHSTSLVI